MRVRVQVKTRRGRLTIQFKSAEELDALVRRFDSGRDDIP